MIIGSVPLTKKIILLFIYLLISLYMMMLFIIIINKKKKGFTKEVYVLHGGSINTYR